MGRIKTMLIKRMSLNLVDKYRGKFKSDFSNNKEAVGKLLDTSSKKIRNIIAGYVTRKIRSEA
ncbi:MAG: 30S ribosomal protein S17e [archaeon]